MIHLKRRFSKNFFFSKKVGPRAAVGPHGSDLRPRVLAFFPLGCKSKCTCKRKGSSANEREASANVGKLFFEKKKFGGINYINSN